MKTSFLYCLTANHFQLVSLLLFSIGLLGVMTSKNLIKILISIEFMVNSINIIFVSFATYRANISYTGYSIAIFVSAISALVMAIGLYFIYHIYKKYGSIDISEVYKISKEKKC